VDLLPAAGHCVRVAGIPLRSAIRAASGELLDRVALPGGVARGATGVAGRKAAIYTERHPGDDVSGLRGTRGRFVRVIDRAPRPEVRPTGGYIFARASVRASHHPAVFRLSDASVPVVLAARCCVSLHTGCMAVVRQTSRTSGG